MAKIAVVAGAQGIDLCRADGGRRSRGSRRNALACRGNGVQRACVAKQRASHNERHGKNPPARAGGVSIACADRNEVYEIFRFSAELLPRFSTSSYSTT